MMTRKVPVDKVERESAGSVEEVVRETLANDPRNAYTILGLMVEKFGVKEEAIASKPFNKWPKTLVMGYKLPSLYTKIRLALETLVERGYAKKSTSGRAQVYWWVDQSISGKLAEVKRYHFGK